MSTADLFFAGLAEISERIEYNAAKMAQPQPRLRFKRPRESHGQLQLLTQRQQHVLPVIEH
jgi:hypothetical protein